MWRAVARPCVYVGPSLLMGLHSYTNLVLFCI